MKIAIAGAAGRVGSSLGIALLASDIKFEKLILYDVVDKVEGDALDLQHASAWLEKGKILWTKNASDCGEADIIIFTADAALPSRDIEDIFRQNKMILEEFLGQVLPSEAVFIIISNPVDVLTYFAAKKVGERFKVLGISTLMDTARLRSLDKGYIIGEHGENLIVIGSKVDGEKIIDIRHRVRALKGGGTNAAALLTLDVIKCIANDEKKIMPISVLLDGEFGLKDVALSVPCMVGADGIELINEIKLTEEQAKLLSKAAKSVKRKISRF